MYVNCACFVILAQYRIVPFTLTFPGNLQNIIMELRPPPPQTLAIILAGFIWYISSAWVNISWKHLYHRQPCVLHLTLIQLTVAEIICLPLFILTEDKPHEIIWSLMKGRNPYIYLIGTAFCIGQLCTNSSLSIVSVSLTHIIKVTEPLIALLLGVTILKENISKRAILFICVILIGIVIATAYDVSFNYKGVGFAALSNVAFQVRNLFTKLSDSNRKGPYKSITIFFLTNAISIAIIFVILFVIKLEHNCFATYMFDFECFLLGISFAGQHIMSFFVLQNVMITTHALLNVIKRLFVIVICSLFLKTYISTFQFVGIILTLIGLYCYSTALRKKVTPSETSSDTQPNAKCMICFTFVCLILVRTYSVSFEKVSAILTRHEIIIQQTTPITTLWSYSRQIDASSETLLESLAGKYINEKITLYCGNKDCLQSKNHLRNIEIRPLKVFSIASGTPISSWVRHHAILKILTGRAFESHLQKALSLALIWKFGGIVIDLDLPIHNADSFISTLDKIKKNSCIMGSNGHQMSICYIERESAFILHLMESFTASFNITGIKSGKLNCRFENIFQFALNEFRMSTDGNVIPFDISNLFTDILGKSKDHSGSKQFGLVHYDRSGNIGDYIQSIAAAHLLPQIDSFLLRDRPHQTVAENTTVIMNAYWRKSNWLFGSTTNINPIFVSIHIASGHSSEMQNILQRRKAFLMENQPIGTRDYATSELLRNVGITAKMTGCLTLFLQNPFTGSPRLNDIYLVDVPRSVKNLLPAHVSQNAKAIHHIVPGVNRDGTSLYKHAYALLEKYARARLVITTRIHCALPCVALETPVIFLNLKSLLGASKNKPTARVTGLLDLFHHIDLYTTTWEEAKGFLQTFDYHNPPPNPNKELANSLRETSWSFLRKVSEIRNSHDIFDLKP